MKSIEEQLKLINKLIQMSTTVIDDDEECYLSIKHSLLSLKQTIYCDLDFFVAVMHKDEYEQFIHYLDKKNEQSNH